MTHEEKMQLARVRGILGFALIWAETVKTLANDKLSEESDVFARGFSWGEITMAESTLHSVKRAIDLLDSISKGAEDD